MRTAQLACTNSEVEHMSFHGLSNRSVREQLVHSADGNRTYGPPSFPRTVPEVAGAPPVQSRLQCHSSPSTYILEAYAQKRRNRIPGLRSLASACISDTLMLLYVHDTHSLHRSGRD